VIADGWLPTAMLPLTTWSVAVLICATAALPLTATQTNAPRLVMPTGAGPTLILSSTSRCRLSSR
jgi:hypothetical protein